MCSKSENTKINKLLQSLAGAYSEATIRGYRTDVFNFITWCEDNALEAFPSAPDTLVRYLEDKSTEGLNPRTLERRVYAIRKFYKLMELPDPTRAPTVNLAFRRIRRSRHARPRQAAALTQSHLEKILQREPDSPRTLRNQLMISLAYDLLARRSEIVALTDDDCHPADGGAYRFIIRRSKADPFGYGRLAFCSPRSARLLEDWWAWRGQGIDWVLCPIYNDKPVNRSLSGTTVRRVVKSAIAGLVDTDLDVEGFSGHSMRVGAAQDLLKLGHDTAGIMRAGGWKSLKVLARYLESAEQNPWI